MCEVLPREELVRGGPVDRAAILPLKELGLSQCSACDVVQAVHTLHVSGASQPLM
jgi:hypothetical protein